LVKPRRASTKDSISRKLSKHPLGVGICCFSNLKSVMESNVSGTAFSVVDNQSKSNNINVRNKKILNPYFITVFSDTESCFSVGLFRDSKRKTGWIVTLEFARALLIYRALQSNLLNKSLNINNL